MSLVVTTVVVVAICTLTVGAIARLLAWSEKEPPNKGKETPNKEEDTTASSSGSDLRWN